MPTPQGSLSHRTLFVLILVFFSACAPPEDPPPLEGATPRLCTEYPYYIDSDGDGIGSQVTFSQTCGHPPGTVLLGGDCDDQDPAIHPGARDTCDGVDNDCDGDFDESLDIQWYLDLDDDGFGQLPRELGSCTPPRYRSLTNKDCDDDNPLVSPAGVESCNDDDDHCDGLTDEAGQEMAYVDDDGDGYGAGEPTGYGRCGEPLHPGLSPLGGDCDDGDETIFPDACEAYDGNDNDCDSVMDEGSLIYPDLDEDGFGDDAEARPYDCDLGDEQLGPDDTFTPGDCDDNKRSTNPYAREGCDLEDDDCDGYIDEGLTHYYLYPDEDGDGYGRAGAEIELTCTQGEGFASEAEDCDDTRSDVYPGADEFCNGVDNNCNGLLDDGAGLDIYPDQDRDGHGAGTQPIRFDCTLKDRESFVNDDCDDGSSLTHPEAPERCDGLDNDCNGRVEAGPEEAYYYDHDEDGHPGEAYSGTYCGPGGSNLKPYSTDCDDSDPAIYPGAYDYVGDDIDQDCGGRDGKQPKIGLGTGSYATLEEAIDRSIEGDTIWIGPATWMSHSLDLDGKNLTLRGVEGRDSTTLHAAQEGPIFEDLNPGESLAFYDLTLEAGAAGEGGVLTLKESSLYAKRVRFDGNSADIRGGAISAHDGDVSLSKVEFVGNTSGDDGGAIFVDGGSLQIGSSTLASNTATGEGGAIYIRDGDLTLNYMSIDNNSAFQGGGVSTSRTQLSLIDSDFEDNDALGGGGGLFMSETTGTIRGDFLRNSSGQGGAGLDAKASDLHLALITLADNIAQGPGGGMRLTNSAVTSDIYTVTVEDNIAVGEGGGIAMLGGEYTFGPMYLWRNRSLAMGGGLAISNNASLVADLKATDNVASQQGGAVFCESSTAEIETRLVGNTSDKDGGGIWIGDGCDLTLHHGELLDNSAPTGFGGAIALSGGGVLRGTDLQMLENSASLGGALSVAADASAWMSQVFFEKNEGETGRDIITLGDLTIGHSVFAPSENQQDLSGQAIISQYHGYFDLWNSVVDEPNGSIAILGRAGGAASFAGNILPGDSTFSGLTNEDFEEIEEFNHLGDPMLMDYYGSDYRYFYDPHLSLSSPGIDLGVPWDCFGTGLTEAEAQTHCLDVDGSPADAGLFGGPLGGRIDWDQDGSPAYPWPGAYEDSPTGLDETLYDPNDLSYSIK